MNAKYWRRSRATMWTPRDASPSVDIADDDDNPLESPTDMPMKRQPTIEEVMVLPSNPFATTFADIIAHRGMIEYPLELCPANAEPFVPDVLCNIMMFVETKSDVLSLSLTCRMWRFYANYLPHWTQFHSRGKLLPFDFFKKRVKSRNELVEPYRREVKERQHKQAWMERKDMCETATAVFINEIFAPAAMVAILVVIHALVGWHVGIDNNGSFGDSQVAAGAAFTFVAFVLIEMLPVFLALVNVSEWITKGENGFKYLRCVLVVWMLTFVVLVPMSMIGGRVNSSEAIVAGGNTSAAERRATIALEGARYVPVRSYVALDHPLGDTARWAHFPTGRPMDDDAFWGTSGGLTVGANDEHIAKTRDILYRNKTHQKNPATKFYGSFFVLYDIATKPNVTNNISLGWGDRTAPRSAITERHCYQQTGYDLMNCLYDHSTSPAWAGTSFIAISGIPEDYRLHIQNGDWKDRVSFRTVRRTANYNSEFWYAEDAWWHHSMNSWWEAGRVYFVESEWPETIEEGQQRIDGLLNDRNVLIYVIIGVAGVAALFPLLDRAPYYWALVWVIAGCILVVNPVTVILMGVLCGGKTTDPRMRDESWLMCQPPAGTGLIIFGVFIIFVYIPIYYALKELWRYQNYLD